METLVIFILSYTLGFASGWGVFYEAPKDPVIEKVYITKTVQVPISSCTATEIPDKPKLEVENLTPEDRKNYGKIVKAYHISLLQCTNYSSSIVNLLEEYK